MDVSFHISVVGRADSQTESYFTFLLSQLRHEHLFCFWCGYKYGSYEEMEGAGGCPGTEEDDH
jgi:hypothetical protein